MDKLRKTLLLLLCSSHDGEALAARSAFMRLLSLEKRDAHDVADAIMLGLQTKPDNHSAAYMASTCWDCFELKTITLSDKEQKFIREMRMWAKPSQKQIQWLKSIYSRVPR
jgi:hypothetical protein